jgi:hypothetical protein
MRFKVPKDWNSVNRKQLHFTFKSMSYTEKEKLCCPKDLLIITIDKKKYKDEKFLFFRIN